MLSVKEFIKKFGTNNSLTNFWKKEIQDTWNKWESTLSPMGQLITNIVDKYAVLEREKGSMFYKETVHIPWTPSQYTFKVNTDLGEREIIVSRDFGKIYKLLYMDKKVLFQYRESRLSTDEPYEIEVTNLAEECNWTSESMLNAVREIHNILSIEYDKVFKRNEKIEKELASC